MGYYGVKTIIESLKGNKVNKRMDTGVLLVNKDNLLQPDVQDLLHPDLKKWLGE